MFQIERLQQIRQMIEEQKSVDVIRLSKQLRVSEVTIRRDLEKLEAEGILTRTYGGAILNESHSSSLDSNTADLFRFEGIADISKENQVLGELSASIVENYDILFLDKCESNCILAENLQNKTGVVVFTNSLDILAIMMKYKTNQVVLTGGSVDYVNNIMSNSNMGVPFPDIKVNKAFLHIKAVDIEFGLAMNDSTDAYLYSQLKEKAKFMVGIMEESVFDKIGLIKVDEITGVDYVITGNGIPDNYKKCFFQNGVQLHQKFNL